MKPDGHDEIEKVNRDDLALDHCHGTWIDDLDQPLILHPARIDSINALNERFFKLILPIGFLFFASVMLLTPSIAWMMLPYAFLILLTYLFMRRKYSRNIAPILILNNDGIQIHSNLFDVFIPWKELETAYSATLVEPHVFIDTKDFRKTIARASPASQLTGWVNSLCVPFYQCVGMKIAPIFILQSELPLSAQDVVDQINARKNYALAIKAGHD